ncbi:sorbosone dehydrogenase family protein [Methylotenera sp.]|uniref:PQQ-dependent sugar dehydrogenase n=1 Tax=Methylotenera sp. TaxID=2051956 RepID=UPI002EDB153B
MNNKKVKSVSSNLFIIAAFLTVTACGEVARLPISAGMGPNPSLPAPNQTIFPTVNIAPAIGWPSGATPVATNGTKVNAFATGLDHPRWLYVLPNGDVLVAETNGPKKSDSEFSIKGWITGLVMSRAGAGVASANRITLLRDLNHDGIADMRLPFIEGLNSPFGMALVGSHLYIANTDSVMRFSYKSGDKSITLPGVKVLDLPAGAINYHWTKNLIASTDATKLYITVGSNSNVAEVGMAAEFERAAIWELDLKSGSHRIYASGLRNPNGLAWDKPSGKLFTVVNERDAIGSDLVPDYLTSVQYGGFYGWPYSYYGQHVDQRVQPQAPELVAKSIAPDYALGSHTGSLGLVSSDGTSLPTQFSHGMFIGQHGSWNRKPHSGYKVIFVAMDNGKPAGLPVDILTGFLSKSGQAYGRPVGVALDKNGALLVADDVGNTVWRVSKLQN